MQATGRGTISCNEVSSSHREVVVRLEVEMVWAVVVEHQTEVLVILR